MWMKAPLFHLSPYLFRTKFNDALSSIGITGHTPHDCRHTFSWLCDKYHVDSLAKKCFWDMPLEQMSRT